MLSRQLIVSTRPDHPAVMSQKFVNAESFVAVNDPRADERFVGVEIPQGLEHGLLGDRLRGPGVGRGEVRGPLGTSCGVKITSTSCGASKGPARSRAYGGGGRRCSGDALVALGVMGRELGRPARPRRRRSWSPR